LCAACRSPVACGATLPTAVERELSFALVGSRNRSGLAAMLGNGVESFGMRWGCLAMVRFWAGMSWEWIGFEVGLASVLGNLG
jgi:hypothetical protein